MTKPNKTYSAVTRALNNIADIWRCAAWEVRAMSYAVLSKPRIDSETAVPITKRYILDLAMLYICGRVKLRNVILSVKNRRPGIFGKDGKYLLGEAADYFED
ncbi:hypothetical protein [Nitrospirillum amazonense]|uniref:hypothetical protein n=1 Tax=Nitrospirillum amazonense TaxID=28077 RepID=UPI002412E15F|nr:hypothetical protein [Nitrospirillum amazonense]MDG3443715.1 hypothetical protein [Nitrospirillum amazonense]